jgi:hypothetical protein
MSEKWNDPTLQKIANDRDERLRRQDIYAAVSRVISDMQVQIDDPCLGRANDEYVGIERVKEWQTALKDALEKQP